MLKAHRSTVVAEEVHMTVAPWSKRALAWLIDMHVSMIFLVVAYVVAVRGFDTYDGLAAWSIFVVSFVLWWMVGFVNRCIRMGRNGQSWGRMLFNISLVREGDGKPIGVWKAFIRENTHFLDWFTLGYGFLRPMKDRKGQTLADKVNRTVTVNGPPPSRPVVIDEPVAEPLPAESVTVVASTANPDPAV
jgi:uncharacterized RDD family membrane protein YckC